MTGFHIRPQLYTRYIDDFFFIWNETLDALKGYKQLFNSHIPGIKLNFEQDAIVCSMHFLDVTVFVHNNSLLTKVYCKPTDRHTLLAHNLFHSRHKFKGILKSQFIRYKNLRHTWLDYTDLINVQSLWGYKAIQMHSMANFVWTRYTGDDRHTTQLTTTSFWH